MKKIIFFFSILFLVCCNRASDFERVLTRNGTFWVLIPIERIENVNYISIYCNNFQTNNKYEEYYINEKDKMLSLNYLNLDMKEWKYITNNDSILKINDTNYELLEYTEDTIYLRSAGSHSSLKGAINGEIYVMYNINKENKYVVE